jgi:hypothetical protein
VSDKIYSEVSGNESDLFSLKPDSDQDFLFYFWWPNGQVALPWRHGEHVADMLQICCRQSGRSPCNVSVDMFIRFQLINFPYRQITLRYVLTLLELYVGIIYPQLALLFIQTIMSRLCYA